MWIVLSLFAAVLAVVAFSETRDSAHTHVVAGARYFDAPARAAIMASLPVLAIKPFSSVPGADTFRLLRLDQGEESAAAAVTAAAAQGLLVAASASLTDTRVADHFLVFAEPSMRLTVASAGSPLAILIDPERET